jgi:TolB-like protein
MPDQPINCGPFVLDAASQALRRGGETIVLGSKGVLLLEALFRRPGEVVTKSELMDAGWAGLAVEESNLTVQVASLRKSLGPAPGGGDWIVTVPRVGYRFVTAAAPAPAEAPKKPSIAVLPFANLSSDAEQTYFCDGLAEEVITALSKLSGLTVMSRNSSFAYRGAAVDVRKVAEELDVRYVLEGSIRRSGDRIRLTAQLCEAPAGGHIWAERYDRELTDVFAIQDDVTRQIVEALKLKLTPEEATRASGGTTDVEALDLFMRGHAVLHATTLSIEVCKRAMDLLRRALERDPAYGRVYEDLSLANIFNYVNRWTDDPDASLAEALRLAEMCVELAPTDPAAHHCLARALNFHGDSDGFVRETELAIGLNPDHPETHSARGHLSLKHNDPLAAIPHFEAAMRQNPSLGSTTFGLQNLGQAYFFANRYETAAALFRERILLWPDSDWSRYLLIASLGQLGRLDEARTVWAELMAINPKFEIVDRLSRTFQLVPGHREAVLDGWRKTGLPSGLAAG